jgi:hypothetical protein
MSHDPSESSYLQLNEEVENYENEAGGEFDELDNLRLPSVPR